MPKIDATFALTGSTVPLDHGYLLYSALSHLVAELHGARWLGVHPLAGQPMDPETLRLHNRPELRLRIPVDRIQSVLPLVGAHLELNGHILQVGVPSLHALTPSRSLDARLVVIKVTNIPRRQRPQHKRQTIDNDQLAVRVGSEVERQLARLDIRRPFRLAGRRSITVNGRRVIGFSLRVHDLDDAESLRLQEEGVGGKRSMGCGIFRPTRGRRA